MRNESCGPARVIRVAHFGGPEVLQPDVRSIGRPGAGEVQIDVERADVIFFDTQVRSGGALWAPLKRPYVPGGGVGGRVRDVGAGVDRAWIGRRVVTRTGGPGGGGGYATRALAAVERLVPVPDGVDLSTATALIHDGATALALASTTGIEPGERVLVLAAGGGLGLLLVQLARASGASVIAAAGSAGKLARAQELGAEVAIDYRQDDWVDRVRGSTGGRGVDVVFDGAGGGFGSRALELVTAHGRFSAHGAPGGFAILDEEDAARRGITVRGIEQVQFTPAESRMWLGRAVAGAAAGRLHPALGRSYPLAEAAEAHRALEARRAVGKTLLETD